MTTRRLFAAQIMGLSLISAAGISIAEAADPKLDDSFINDSVRQRLAADAVVKGGAVDVDVKDGVVTLSGHVQDAKQKSRAESLAKKVKGVKSVVNKIQIVPQ